MAAETRRSASSDYFLVEPRVLGPWTFAGREFGPFTLDGQLLSKYTEIPREDRVPLLRHLGEDIIIALSGNDAGRFEAHVVAGNTPVEYWIGAEPDGGLPIDLTDTIPEHGLNSKRTDIKLSANGEILKIVGGISRAAKNLNVVAVSTPGFVSLWNNYIKTR